MNRDIPVRRPIEVEIADDSEEDILARIATISQNAKASWFGLIVVLGLVTAILARHQDSDFYTLNAATTLAQVGLDVPPLSFFAAAPILIAMIYVYLHLYLLLLWDTLGRAPNVVKGDCLGNKAHPTLLTSMAIRYRSLMREDGSAPSLGMGRLSTIAAFSILWLAALVVLAALWWRGMPARDMMVQWFTSLSLFVSILVGTGGALHAHRRLADRSVDRRDFTLHQAAVGIVLALFLFAGTLMRSGDVEGTPFPDTWLAEIDLVEKTFTERRADWLPLEEWRKDFEPLYRARQFNRLPVDLTNRQRKALRQSEGQRRGAELNALAKSPHLKGRDLRKARLDRAFLPGVDLRGSNLSGASLIGADLERALLWCEPTLTDHGYVLFYSTDCTDLSKANLRRARLEGADLREARLEGANLTAARLEGADLFGARLEGAVLYTARLEGARLVGARLEGANLREARLEGASLNGARLEGTNLSWARLEGADLYTARLEGANLRNARLEGADLFGARLEGADLFGARLEGADLVAARLEGASLFGANLKSTDLGDWSIVRTSLRSADFTEAENLTQQAVNTAFGDRATILPDGLTRPPHWDVEPLGVFDPGYRNLEEDKAYQAWLATLPDAP